MKHLGDNSSVLESPSASWGQFANLLILFEPQFPHLTYGNNSTYPVALFEHVMRGRWRPNYLDLMSSGYEGTPTPKAMGPTGRFKVRVVNLPRIEALSEKGSRSPSQHLLWHIILYQCLIDNKWQHNRKHAQKQLIAALHVAQTKLYSEYERKYHPCFSLRKICILNSKTSYFMFYFVLEMKK